MEKYQMLPTCQGNAEFASCDHLLKYSPNPTLLVNASDLIIQFANPIFCQDVVQNEIDLVGLHLGTIFRDSLLQQLSLVVEGFNASPIPRLIAETEIGDGTLRHWNLLLWPSFVPEIPLSSIVIEMVEVTELVLAREKLVEMNQRLLISSIHLHKFFAVEKELNRKMREVGDTKNQFIAVMNHEIRTPLNAVMGFSELLGSDHLSEGDRLEFAGRIKRNGEFLLHLIEDMLDLSKIEADRLILEKVEKNLLQTLVDLQKIFEPKAASKGLTLVWNLASNLPERIVTDFTRLKQIIGNLVGNAIKFTDHGSVKVSVSKVTDKQFLHFVIEDTGEGISLEHRKNLFQPFAQADASITRRFGGTGVGLHLSKRLAQALGGDVALVESELGRGSVFAFTIAYDKPLSNIVEKTIPFVQKDGDLKGYKILLAEDAIDNQALLDHILRGVGCEIKIVENGLLVVSEALKSQYDVILMDISMPIMDGIAATRSLREKGYKKGIIALSAHAMKPEIDACMEAGCNAHLAKPINIPLLIETIRTVKERANSNDG